MNENKVIVWVYALVTAVIAVLATAFYMILEEYYIEAGTGLYKLGAATPEAFGVFMTLGVIVIIASLFLFRKDSMPKAVYGIPVITSVLSILAAVVLVFSSVTFLMSAKTDYIAISNTAIYKIKYAGAFVAFFAALYYVLIVFSGKAYTKIRGAFSFFPLIWTWTFLMGVYFDHNADLSSPVRIVREIALILLMLYQLMETRALLGKSKPSIYLIISSLSLMFLCPAFMPTVFEWIKGGVSLTLDTMYDLYGGIMAFYIFSRIIGYAVRCGKDGLKKPKKKKHGKNDIFTEEDEDAEHPVVAEENSLSVEETESVAEDVFEENENDGAEAVEQIFGEEETK